MKIGVKMLIFLNPSALTITAPIAQLDRASAYGAEGWGFDSLWAHLDLTYFPFADLPSNQIVTILDHFYDPLSCLQIVYIRMAVWTSKVHLDE